MSEKKIPKALLDVAIRQARHWCDLCYSTEEKDVCCLIDASRAVERASQIGMGVIDDLLMSIFRYHGLKNDATNEDIYKVLEVFGWEVE